MRPDALDLSTDAGLCRGCNQRRVLCAHAWCRQCHQAPRHDNWRVGFSDTPIHLCCGWWGYADALPWRCLTCGAVRTRRHS